MTELKAGDTVKVQIEGVLLEKRPGEITRIQVTEGPAQWSVALPNSADIVNHTPKLAPLPTEPGIYADKDGYPWVLTSETVSYGRRWEFHGTFNTPNEAALFAPFTRLIPESALAEAKQEAYREALQAIEDTNSTNCMYIKNQVSKRLGLEPSA